MKKETYLLMPSPCVRYLMIGCTTLSTVIFTELTTSLQVLGRRKVSLVRSFKVFFFISKALGADVKTNLYV